MRQSVLTYSPAKIRRTVKSLMAREIFKRLPKVKERFWVREFWSKGYFISTVVRHGSEERVQRYVKQQNQTKEYERLHHQRLNLFKT